MSEGSIKRRHVHSAWRIPILLLLLSVVVVSGCSSLSEKTGQMTIDPTFTVDGFGWKGGSIVYVFLKVRENQGKVEVCAAYMSRGGTSHEVQLSREVLGAGYVTVDGVRAIQGLAFANRIPETDDVAGQSASCARGNTDWKPDYTRASVDAKFPRMRFRL